MGDNDFPYLGDSRFRDLLYRGEEKEDVTLPLPNRGDDPFRPYEEFATLPLPNRGGVPNRPYSPPPEPAKPTQPEEGFDGFREKYGIPKAFESSDFLREYIGGSPSFDLDPDIDSPIIDRDIKEYREKYGPPKMPSGPELRRRIENLRQRYGNLMATNQGPSTPVKYDEGMGGFVPNPGAGRPTNIRYKGTV